MAARREEASIDLQQGGSLAVCGERSADERSSVDVAQPTNVAKATMNPISTIRLMETSDGYMR